MRHLVLAALWAALAGWLWYDGRPAGIWLAYSLVAAGFNLGLWIGPGGRPRERRVG